MGSIDNLFIQNLASQFPMNTLEPEEFRRQGHLMIDFLADYYQKVEEYPVRSQVSPGYLREILPESAPYNPESLETILQDVQTKIIPGITINWQSPNFFAYFPSSGSTAGFLGEMLSTGFNVVGFHWMASPAATELENVVTDWFGKMLQLPKSFLFSGGGGGVLQGTTCEAMLCTLVAARDKNLRQHGMENIGKLVVYCSDQTHSAMQKAAKIAGIDPKNFRTVETSRASNFQLCPRRLESAILTDIQNGLIPLYLCATVGTTSSTAVDPLPALTEVAKKYDLWVHVDAAYAGSACICPELRQYLNGVENADSFSLNAHKWFLTTLDCCCLWVKNPSALIKSLSTYPEFLRNNASETNKVVDYKDWQIMLSRRFRALKLWFVLRSYGVGQLREFIRGHVDMAKYFEGLVGKDKRFEVVVPRLFSMVCIRVRPSAMTGKSCGNDVNELNRKLLESLNESGRIYVSHTVLDGIYIIRFAIGATLTDINHVSAAWKVVQDHATALLDDTNFLAKKVADIILS
ncbi:LOW QUALITY PROTEIN: tyrosine decarboxylase 1-like [Daucus carota subsp. sativus]|uniref:LOW QUALITY PROTEIN: tyrosine decarboxylase 1-like n=1 Tax=Daucus carota subsp. sativus TaxID=79200 RepID=UPI0030831938